MILGGLLTVDPRSSVRGRPPKSVPIIIEETGQEAIETKKLSYEELERKLAKAVVDLEWYKGYRQAVLDIFGNKSENEVGG